jgi:hypothetical protein
MAGQVDTGDKNSYQAILNDVIRCDHNLNIITFLYFIFVIAIRSQMMTLYYKPKHVADNSQIYAKPFLVKRPFAFTAL